MERLNELIVAVRPEDIREALQAVMRGDVLTTDRLGFLVDVKELPQLQAAVREAYGNEFDPDRAEPPMIMPGTIEVSHWSGVGVERAAQAIAALIGSRVRVRRAEQRLAEAQQRAIDPEIIESLQRNAEAVDDCVRRLRETGEKFKLTDGAQQSLLTPLAQLLGTDEAVARDWLIAKVSTFRGESEATTAQRFEEL